MGTGVSVVVGVVCFILGVGLSLTGIGAIIGIPLILFGVALAIGGPIVSAIGLIAPSEAEREDIMSSSRCRICVDKSSLPSLHSIEYGKGLKVASRERRNLREAERIKREFEDERE